MPGVVVLVSDSSQLMTVCPYGVEWCLLCPQCFGTLAVPGNTQTRAHLVLLTACSFKKKSTNASVVKCHVALLLWMEGLVVAGAHNKEPNQHISGWKRWHANVYLLSFYPIQQIKSFHNWHQLLFTHFQRLMCSLFIANCYKWKPRMAVGAKM